MKEMKNTAYWKAKMDASPLKKDFVPVIENQSSVSDSVSRGTPNIRPVEVDKRSDKQVKFENLQKAVKEGQTKKHELHSTDELNKKKIKAMATLNPIASLFTGRKVKKS